MDPTERASLPRTGLTVTKLGLGTGPIGGLYAPVADSEAHAAIERAWEIGLRLFDTAPFYGYGDAEKRLGHVLSGKPRDQFVLSTKVGRLLRAPSSSDEPDSDADMWQFAQPPEVKPIFDFSYDGAMRSVEESLQRLGIERVDILYIHDPYQYFDEAISGAYRALEKLRGEGVVKGIGVGMGQADALVRYAHHGDFDCFLLAGQYTLLEQVALQELLPLCLERSIAVIMGSVFHGGLLAGPQPGRAFDDVPAETRQKIERLQAVCNRFGVSMKAAALQFSLGHPAVVSLLTGVRSVAELEENVRLFRTPIPPEFWEALHGAGLLPETAPRQ